MNSCSLEELEYRSTCVMCMWAKTLKSVNACSKTT